MIDYMMGVISNGAVDCCCVWMQGKYIYTSKGIELKKTI